MHILVVEDDSTVRAMLSDVLRFEGFTVSHASNGRAALEACEEGRPDVMLLDLAMPVLSGFELLDEFEARGNRDLPIVAMSATQEFVRAARPRVTAVIRKPFDIEDLVAIIAGATASPRAG